MQEPHKIPVIDDEPDLEQLVRQSMRHEIRSGLCEFTRKGVEALKQLNEARISISYESCLRGIST